LTSRWIAVLAAVALCLTLCGCDVEILPPSDDWEPAVTQTTVATTTTTVAPDAEVPLTLLENGYAYSLLSEEQQENYDAIVKELYDKRGMNTKADGERGLTVKLKNHVRSEEEIEELFYAVFDDHPEFFYLRSKYSWFKIGNRFTRLSFFYSWDAEERAVKATELEAAVSSLVTQAQGLSDAEAEQLFHDTLIEKNEYNTAAASDSAAQSDAYYAASSPYAALCTGDAICGGYSRAFHLLLSRVGIPNTALINDDHAWSMVWLDGEAYHVDVTWDDPVGVENGERHSYFNITDDEARATRDIPQQVRELPAATATTYNYHTMNGLVFGDVYDDGIAECILTQIENGAEQVILKFDPEEYEDAVNRFFEDQTFFDIVYELDDDTLRDRWYAQMTYQGEERIGDIIIFPSE